MTRAQWGIVLALVLAGSAAAWIATARTDAPPPPADLEIEITSPAEGEVVGMRHTVSGRASDPSARIHVLLHPVETDLWWVQTPPAPTKADGTWKTRVYFGTETQGAGEEFDILAIATGRELAPGDTLDVGDLPSDVARSDVMTVTRGR